MKLCAKYCSCHQKPERSFFICGYQFPLCARCTGIAIGHIVALFIAPFHTFKYSIALLLFPLAIDGTVQYCTPYESNNCRRVLTGTLYGFAFTSISWRFIKAILHKQKTPLHYRRRLYLSRKKRNRPGRYKREKTVDTQQCHLVKSKSIKLRLKNTAHFHKNELYSFLTAICIKLKFSHS